MIKKIIGFLVTLLIILTSRVYAQKGYFESKDYRILKNEKTMVCYLIHTGQLDTLNRVFKIEDYQGKIYIRKCLEIYVKPFSILLVQFGSLADHADEYWGILNEKRNVFFNDLNDLRFTNFTQSNESASTVIRCYINSYALSKK